MKTPEELQTLKTEVAALNEKLAELDEEELAQVTGGVLPILLGNNATVPAFIPCVPIFKE